MKICRYVGNTKFCNDPEYLGALKSSGTCKIDTLSEKNNVSCDFFSDGKPIQFPENTLSRDLLDLAISVYIADEVSSRYSQEDNWTRTFDIVYPVKNLQVWDKNKQIIENTLEFLSGDEFKISFKKLKKDMPVKKHRRSIDAGYDTICLFSGGVDSFVGAYNCLKKGHKTLLVGHYADGITSYAQNEMYSVLSQIFGSQVCLVKSFIAKSRVQKPRFILPEKTEDSHRTRSFLFLSVAIHLAKSLGINNIVIPENGIITLNVPLSVSRIGSLSTRTTHPRYLQNVTHIHKALKLNKKLVFENPFLLKSKTDVVKILPKNLYKILRKTVSCSHAGSVRWKGIPKARHCGYCIPCLYRRIALKAVSQDYANDYTVDVFTNYNNLSYTEKADFYSLVDFSQKILSLNNAELNVLVTKHGAFAPQVGKMILNNGTSFSTYEPWANMIRSYAAESTETLKSACSNRVKASIGL